MDMTDSRPFLTRFFIAQAKRITVPFIKGIENMFSESEKNVNEGLDNDGSPIYNGNKNKQ